VLFQPRAVERRAAYRKIDAFHPSRASKDLWLFKYRDHVGVIQQALGIAGKLEAFLRVDSAEIAVSSALSLSSRKCCTLSLEPPFAAARRG
jgi:hypothetical protein